MANGDPIRLDGTFLPPTPDYAFDSGTTMNFSDPYTFSNPYAFSDPSPNPYHEIDYSSSTTNEYSGVYDPNDWYFDHPSLAVNAYGASYQPQSQMYSPAFSSTLSSPAPDFGSTATNWWDPSDIFGRGLPSTDIEDIISGRTITGQPSGERYVSDFEKQSTRRLKIANDKLENDKWYHDPLLKIFALQFGLGILTTERQTAAQEKENEKDREFRRQESAAAHERALEQIQAQADAEGGEAGDTSQAFNLFTRRSDA